MLEPGALDEYIISNGPYLYHATSSTSVNSILHEGLRPGSELGITNSDDPFLATRQGRVYLCLFDTAQDTVQVPGSKSILQIDLRALDCLAIGPDEDVVAFACIGFGLGGFDFPHKAVAHLPRPPERPKDPHWRPGTNGEGTRAYWAETTNGFDAPAITALSLTRGRISYAGTIPPAAITPLERDS